MRYRKKLLGGAVEEISLQEGMEREGKNELALVLSLISAWYTEIYAGNGEAILVTMRERPGKSQRTPS